MASNEWLVRKLHEQDKKIEALSRGGTGVGHSSIAPGENLTVISDNGEVVLGAGGVEHVDGPTPATPSAPTLKLGFGTIETTWDGTFAEGEDEDGVPLTAPVDFDVVEVHCSTDPEEEEWGDDTMRGQIKTREGGTITVGGFDVEDEVFVCLIALAKTGKRSAPSATASLIIEGLDFSQLFNELDAANATIKNAGEILVTEQGTLDEKLTEVDGTLNDLGQDLQAVEDAQAQLNTDLTDVMTSVDGKNTITWNPSAPSAVSNPGKAVGDLWYRTSGNSIIGFWKWDGTDWITQLLDKTTIPLIDIGAGTFGNLAGARLTAGSIGAEKLYIGVPGNLVVDPTFEQGTSGRTIGAHTLVTEGGVRKFRADAANSQFSAWGLNGVSIPAVEGQVYRFECEFDATGGGGVRVFGSVRNGLGTVISAIGSPTVTGSGKFVWETVMPAAGASVSCSFRASQAGVKIWLPTAYQIAGATTIQDGVVSTQKLTADVLEVKNLKATSGQLNEAVINKLFSDVVVAKTAVANAFIGENAILTGAVTAPKITASEELWAKIAQFVKIRAEHIEADAIDGMVITGATIRSAATGARVQLSATGIESYNDANDRTFYAEASSGNVYMVGSFYSNKEGEPRVAIKNSDWASIGVPDENGNLHYTNGAGIRIGSNATSGFSIYHGAWRNVGDPPEYIRGQSAVIEGPLARTDLSLNDSGNVELESRNSSGVTVGRLGIRGSGSVYGTSYSNGARVLALELGSGRADLSSFSSSGHVWGSAGANNSGSGYIESTNGAGLIRSTVKTNSDGTVGITGSAPVTITSQNSTVFTTQTSGSSVLVVMPTAGALTDTGTANAVLSAGGGLRRNGSSIRYKTEVEEKPISEYADQLLSIPLKTWVDKGEYERRAEYLEWRETTPVGPAPAEFADFREELPRIPGVIAEELDAAGLTEFVIYDAFGRPESVAYDRIGPALIPIVRDLLDRITELERLINERP